MRLALIAAVAENGIIGRDGALPWRLPADLRWFRAKTSGHHVIMGRTTWESLPQPLVGRTNVVLTRQADYSAPGAWIVSSLDQAIAYAAERGDDEAFVIGGGSVYREALPRCDRLYMTRVLVPVAGDVTFPELPEEATFVETFREHHEPDARNSLPFAFTVLDRA